jgi:hypothetical protein
MLMPATSETTSIQRSASSVVNSLVTSDLQLVYRYNHTMNMKGVGLILASKPAIETAIKGTPMQANTE